MTVMSSSRAATQTPPDPPRIWHVELAGLMHRHDHTRQQKVIVHKLGHFLKAKNPINFSMNFWIPTNTPFLYPRPDQSPRCFRVPTPLCPAPVAPVDPFSNLMQHRLNKVATCLPLSLKWASIIGPGHRPSPPCGS